MRGMRLFVTLVFVVSQFLVNVPVSAQPINSSDVVISQMYPGTYSGGWKDQEFIELYNNTLVPVDVTNWCMHYVPYTGSIGDDKQELACLIPQNTDTKLWLSPHGRAIFVSNEFNQAISTTSDAYFNGGISQLKGYVRLLDSQKQEVDRLGWGNVSDETYLAAIKPTSGNALQRMINNGVMQDTGSDQNDFMEVVNITIHASNIYEEQIMVDACPNLTEYSALPDGYIHDENGDCQPDSCINLDGLQISVPDGYDSSIDGICMIHDECDNLPDAQETIPEYMVRGDNNDCIIEYSPLALTEILPNAIGSDNGNEFIEVYNPGSATINLTLYSIKMGINGDKIYSFPIGATIGPGEYRTFSDSQMKFTLVNSSGRVVLTAIGGKVFGDTGEYESASDGESWALLGDTWRYTNRPTPGDENLSSIVEADDDSASSASLLKPCSPDQFRNPETNRCKKIESSTLAPCSEGQYRNQETNRCRKVSAASSSLKPCASNQYRNPETNRCRKKDVGSVPEAAYKVQSVADGDMVFAGWWALGGVGALAGSYAGWEWRRELMNIRSRLLRLFNR